MNCSDSVNGSGVEKGRKSHRPKLFLNLWKNGKVSLEKAIDMIGLTGSEREAAKRQNRNAKITAIFLDDILGNGRVSFMPTKRLSKTEVMA